MVRTLFVSCVCCVAILLVLPFMVNAQGADLRTEIYNAVVADPSVQELSNEELAELVDLLTAEAQSRGVTAADFRDVSFEDVIAAAQAEEVCAYPAFICATNEAFGFSGNDTRLPITLGAAAGMLVIILGLILTRRHFRERIVGGGFKDAGA